MSKTLWKLNEWAREWVSASTSLVTKKATSEHHGWDVYCSVVLLFCQTSRIVGQIYRGKDNSGLVNQSKGALTFPVLQSRRASTYCIFNQMERNNEKLAKTLQIRISCSE